MLGRMGRTAEAPQLLAELEQGTCPVPPYEIAGVYAGLGDVDHALEWLEKAYSVRDVNLAFLLVDPKLDPLRADARMQALIDRCGFTLANHDRPLTY